MSMSEVVRKMFEEVFVNAEAIIDWVEAGNGESPTLEYKVERKHATKGGSDDYEPHRALAREATAFANSDGGIIVWGVNQKQGEAPSVQLLDDAEKFRNNLVQKTVDISSPPILGLKHEAHMVGDKRGFVATYVPQSNDRPHMAMASEGRYFVRSGESCTVMMHRQVQDAMMAKTRPNLVIECTNGYFEAENHHLFQRYIEMRIKNIGLVTAKNLSLATKNSRGKFHIFTNSIMNDNVNHTMNQTLVVQRWRISELHPFETRFGIKIGPATGESENNWKDSTLDIGLFADDFCEFYRIKFNVRAINLGASATESMFELLEPDSKYRNEIIESLSLSEPSF
jgi:hypothetical protein